MFTLTLTENPKCEVSLMQDLDVQRGCRHFDHNHAQLIRPAAAFTVAGEAYIAGIPTLVFESVRRVTKQDRSSIVHVPVDGAGGCSIE